MAAKKIKKDSEKVCETFEVSDGKTEKEKIVCGDLQNKHSSKKQMKQFNKTLGIILIVLIVLTALFFSIYYITKYTAKIDYKGTEFTKIKRGQVTFYHTTIPSVIEGKKIEYNIYLRNNPNDLAKRINLNDTIKWRNLIVLNISQRYPECDGDDVISEANINQVLKTGMGLTVGKDEKAGCDAQGRYMYIELDQGNKTQIEKFGPSCYKLEFNNCEILPVTERILIEAIAEYNKNSQK